MSKRKWNLQDLIRAVKNSEHITEVIRLLGLRHSSLNTQTIQKYIEEYKLNTSHWKGQIVQKPRTGYEYGLEDVFKKDSTFTRSHLKEKILKYALLEHKCSECKLGPEWNGKSLTLQVDHINGDNKDHRIENLRFLCPNCHSQTPTYAGSNALNRKPAETFTCTKCGEYRSRVSKSGLCSACFSTKEKFEWPSSKELIEKLKTQSPYQIAKELGVSFPGLYKHLKKMGIPY